MWKLLSGQGLLRLLLNFRLQIFKSLYSIGERKECISSEFGEIIIIIIFCHLQRPGTNINSCLTYEKLIRWHKLCMWEKIYQWVVWGVRRALKSKTKVILFSRSHLGRVFVCPLCLKMVNTELFIGNSLVVRELVFSVEFITMCLSAVWKHRRQFTKM